MRPIKTTSFFTLCSKHTARAAGKPAAFLTALSIVAIWGATGPLFHYSDTWQLVINTGTTVITFLMVFLIQSTQNRDSEAMHLKLDELIRAIQGAHNALLDLEELEEKDLDRIREDYRALARTAREEIKVGRVLSGRRDQKG
jgi:low affinity Fe/Cu permease